MLHNVYDCILRTLKVLLIRKILLTKHFTLLYLNTLIGIIMKQYKDISIVRYYPKINSFNFVIAVPLSWANYQNETSQ